VTARRTRRPGEAGRAEFVVLALVALGFGAVFLWALVLHPADDRPRSTTASTATTTVDPAVPVTVPPPRRYRVVQGVNLREKPASNSALLTTIPEGTTILVECRITGGSVTAPEGQSDQWVKTTFTDQTGFVSVVYVNAGDELLDATKVAVCPSAG